jgi:hypothetical protein
MGAVTNPKEPKIPNRMHRHRRFDMSYVGKKQIFPKQNVVEVSIRPMWKRNV